MTNSYKKALRATLLALSVTAFLLAGCSAKVEDVTAPETTTPVTVPVAVETVPPTTERVLEEGQMEYNGEVYQRREDLTTLLIMGLDKYERPEDHIGYTNTLQSDFLLLLVIDEEAGKCEALNLNRDTMTEIRRLGIGGDAAGTFTGQLALAHTYGSGGSDSCINATKAVSNLLGGVEIDHYMTLTMDAVGILNDLLGGITVTLLDDFTELDPAMEQGKEMRLMGEQALLYVRTRFGLENSSNLHRMERQEQYLNALYARLMEVCKGESNFLGTALLKLADAFNSDCTVTQLEKLEDTLELCEVAPIRTIDGEAVRGEEFIEFYPDKYALNELILELFWERVD